MRTAWGALALAPLLILARPSTLEAPRTRAERSGFTETSHYVDVIAFLDALAQSGSPMARSTIGVTTEGRQMPMVVLSRPRVTTPDDAHRLGRPIVYVQANIHAGEVEGKEAVLALIRSLLQQQSPSVLDSLVLIIEPIYNADGNEKFAAQAMNRTEQNGPELVGQRPNGQGLDLNRDYIKAEAPETQASLATFNAWDPDVFVDLHTTDGSFHGYALTYAPSLNPAALFGGAYARDSLLPELRRRMRDRHKFEVFDYGNFSNTYGDEVLTDTVKRGWYTYDSRPRFGTNYYGLRERIAILSEAYSHDPFERRIQATLAFVTEILSLVSERRNAILALRRKADSSVVAWGGAPDRAPRLALRSRLTTTPTMQDVASEDLVATGDSSLTQPGVPRGFRRTGHFRTQRMPVYDRFEGTLERSLPNAYAIPAADTAALRLLKLHGVQVQPVTAGLSVRAATFTVDSVVTSLQPFQGHHEVRIAGRWSESTRSIPAGWWLVRPQPRMVVAFYLLEPESDDGLVTWNVLDSELKVGGEYPILRVLTPP